MGEKTYELRTELTSEQRKNLNKYSDLLAKLLFYRGLTTNELANQFITADYEAGLHDPFLLKDMVKAVERILSAIRGDEMICIFSDYDADGVPGAVVLHDFFRRIGYENFFVYIPHRNLEGFGLNNGAVEEIADKGTKLVVTIDCGIADLSQIDLANKLGMDVIVTDHHEPAHGIPKALAVVDPKRPECQYPDKSLCGAGVIFKVVQGLIAKIKEDEAGFGGKIKTENLNPGWEKWLLDMVGIATLSDMVPLTGENRIFAKYGLQVLQKSPRKGLVKLLSKSFADQKNLTEEDVVFTITPRINAASRMGHPDTAFQMLSTTDDVEADQTIQHLEKINNERKGVVAGMVKEIKKYVEASLMKDSELSVPVIVKGNPKWSPSLLGLAASNIVEAYNCPVFLWGRGEGEELKGSCRSDGSASVVSVMQNTTEGTLATFGGHVMAGGFVVEFAAIDHLEAELIKAYQTVASTESNLFHKMIDARLSVDDVNWQLFDDLKKLAPFGMGNDKPTFVFENVLLEKFEKFGKEQNHGKLLFQKKDGTTLEAIKFFITDEPKIFNLKSGDRINFSANLEKALFGGRVSLRLRLIDVFN